LNFYQIGIALINKGKILVEGKPDDLKKEYNARNIEEVFIGAIQ